MQAKQVRGQTEDEGVAKGPLQRTHRTEVDVSTAAGSVIPPLWPLRRDETFEVCPPTPIGWDGIEAKRRLECDTTLCAASGRHAFYVALFRVAGKDAKARLECRWVSISKVLAEAARHGEPVRSVVRPKNDCVVVALKLQVVHTLLRHLVTSL